MAKAGGRRRPNRARDRHQQSSPGPGASVPVGPGPRSVAAGPGRGRHRGGRAGGLRRQRRRPRPPPGPARDRAGAGLDRGGQPGPRRVPARVGVGRLAARLAASRAGQALRPGVVGRSRGDGRRHDHGRDARLRRPPPSTPAGPPRRPRSRRPPRARAPGGGATRTTSRAWYALGRDAEFIGTVATAVETLHAFQHLPALERLLPLPGTARPAAAQARPPRTQRRPAPRPPTSGCSAGSARCWPRPSRPSSREEAEALSARAQELMAKYSIDHALLAAESGREETPGGRRIAVDNPYEAPKATLLQTVAQANRCRVVWSKERRPGHGHRLPGRPGRGRAAVHLAAGPGEHRDAAGGRQAGRATAGQGRGPSASRSWSPTRSGSASGCRRRPATPSRRRWPSSGPHGRPPERPRGTAPTWCRSSRRATGRSTTRWRRCSAPGSPGAGRSGSTDAEGWTSGRAAADLASLHNQAQVVG